MIFYLGNTDNNWFSYLSNKSPEDVNFWQPKGKSNFKALKQGAPFLFKLKSPHHAIGGIGFFSSHTSLPINMAWDVFGSRNGCSSFNAFKQMIIPYRTDKENNNPTIGCIVLTNPIFFRKEDWINVAPFMTNIGIVQGKSFDTQDSLGSQLWQQINITLLKYFDVSALENRETEFTYADTEWPGYGNSFLQKVRVGQGAFRILVTDAYNRRCSISGEKTLPVLEAAHIKSYSQEGPQKISNGLLLRSDIHKLFDSGYITITKNYKIEVSKAIKEEFENGREYYQFHGRTLMFLPAREIDRPDPSFIEWHNYSFNG